MKIRPFSQQEPEVKHGIQREIHISILVFEAFHCLTCLAPLSHSLRSRRGKAPLPPNNRPYCKWLFHTLEDAARILKRKKGKEEPVFVQATKQTHFYWFKLGHSLSSLSLEMCCLCVERRNKTRCWFGFRLL